MHICQCKVGKDSYLQNQKGRQFNMPCRKQVTAVLIIYYISEIKNITICECVSLNDTTKTLMQKIQNKAGISERGSKLHDITGLMTRHPQRSGGYQLVHLTNPFCKRSLPLVDVTHNSLFRKSLNGTGTRNNIVLKFSY